MRKQEIEKARNRFFNTGANTTQLKAQIAKDLDPIRNAYEIAVSAWDQVEVLLQGVSHEERPTKALRELAATMKDLATVLTAFRTEARQTAQFHTSVATVATVGPNGSDEQGTDR